MTQESMTLLERLRNPQWVHTSLTTAPFLDTKQTRADMTEAADALDGEVVCRKALVNEVRHLSEALAEANEVLRSTYAVAQREGSETGWEAFRSRVSDVLNKQHAIMYPKEQGA
jgi:hypothetical protein